MSSGSLQIRPLTSDDYPAVVALWENAPGIELCEGDSQSELASYLQRNPALSYVACDSGDIVAAALCGHDGRRGFIYHLAVAPTHRGRGVAQRLVDECADGLRNAGIRRAIILVANDNAIGRAFWLRNGWELIDGAVAMTREL